MYVDIQWRMSDLTLKARVTDAKQASCCERREAAFAIQVPPASCLGLSRAPTGHSDAEEVGLERVVSSHFVQAVGSALKPAI